MDNSLCLYKEKLKDALALVPNMSPEKKADAVAYWNQLAEQLQDIIHKNQYVQATSNQSSHVRSDDHLNPIGYSNAQNSSSIDAIQYNTHVITNLASNLEVESAMVTPAIKQAPINHFHKENLLNEGIFDSACLAVANPTVNDCKNHISDLLDDKLSSAPLSTDISSTYTITQLTPSCSTGPQASLISNACSNTQTNVNGRSSEPYSVIKQSDMMTQITSQKLNVSKSINNLTAGLSNRDIFCPSVDETQLGSNTQILNYLTNESTSLSSAGINKLDQTILNTRVEYDNVLVNSSQDCPRTTTNITGDIGNGQFDRGPKLYDDLDEFTTHYESNSQLISLNPPIVSNTFVSTRNESFTQSDRPLQPIQLFNPNSEVYVNQSYAYMNSRVKYTYCNTCNQQFEGSEDLERHEQLHSLEKGPSTSSSVDADAISLSIMEIKSEINSNSESDKGTTDSRMSNQHTCGVCGKSGFSTKGNLKRHFRAHSGEKPFKCDYCDSCFTEKKSLKIHVRRHTGEKPYKCDVCGKLFSQTGVLQSHMALHLNERKFDCQKCGKAFRQRSQLKLHLMRHDGIKRLGCPVCNAKFLTKGDLERHCRIHTGERPYACKICDKTFTRQQSLNEHMNRHTGRKPYDCKYCERTFSEMSAFYKHSKTHKRQDQMQQQQQQQNVLTPTRGST